jgi:hypothetical protein
MYVLCLVILLVSLEHTSTKIVISVQCKCANLVQHELKRLMCPEVSPPKIMKSGTLIPA